MGSINVLMKKVRRRCMLNNMYTNSMREPHMQLFILVQDEGYNKRICKREGGTDEPMHIQPSVSLV